MMMMMTTLLCSELQHVDQDDMVQGGSITVIVTMVVYVMTPVAPAHVLKDTLGQIVDRVQEVS